MKVEKDFEEFIKLLNKNKVKYLIVGGYALALYVKPRNTGDIDFFVERSVENAKRILKTLSEFGFEELKITVKDLTNDNTVIQLGFPPVRIDIISSISGVDFEEAFNEKNEYRFGETLTYFISKNHLIINKEASGRKKDLIDLEMLRKRDNK